MTISRTWFWVGGAALVAAMAGYQFGNSGRDVEPLPPTAAQVSIFELVLKDTHGRAQPLKTWRGHVLVVNYWATWCHPCREEMPGFSRLHDKYRGKMIQFVGISSDDADKIIEFEKTTPVSYPLLIGDMTVMQGSAALGNRHQALPFTAVFDRQGRLAMTRLGRWNEADLERELQGLISG